MSLTVFALALSLAAAPVLGAVDLSAVQWKNRVLILFADADDVRYGEQLGLLKAVADGLAERDMLVLGVTAQDVTTIFGSVSGLDVDAVRKKAGANGGKPFEAVLIGKDGGVKQRWTTPVRPETLFAIIDAMPTRASELVR